MKIKSSFFIKTVVLSAVYAALALNFLLFSGCGDGGGGGSGSSDTTPPGEITLTGVTVADTSVSFTWTDPTDTDFASVQISCSDTSSATVVPEDEAYSKSGLEVTTSYTFILKTADTGGNLSQGVSVTVSTLSSGAAGEDFLLIYTAEELNAVRGGVAGYSSWGLNKNYLLMTDIDLEGTAYDPWTPLGDYSTNSSYIFTGIFQGNNHVIRNLTIDNGLTSYQGLFGYTEGSSIENLGLEDVSVTGKQYTGSLVGYNNKGSISKCYSAGTVNGTSCVGGLVGENYSYTGNATISECYTVVTVEGSDSSVGGLVGYHFAYGNTAEISKSYATGTVTGSSQTGGLVGKQTTLYGTARITESYATGAVTGVYSYVGGLVGYNDPYDGTSEITKSYATGEVKATGASPQYLGGLIGANSSDRCTTTVSNCYATGAVTGSSDVGGLVGYNEIVNTGTLSITNCYAAGLVTCTTNAGGFAGNHTGGAMTDCFWDTQTTGQADSDDPDTDGMIGKTTNEMKLEGTYTNWDFVNVWTNNGGYPYLTID